MIQPHDIGALNPEDLISGHNGEKQILKVKRTLVVTKPNGRTQCTERICDDQWGNTYLVYSAKLSDREVYEVADYVKPSVLKKYGGFTDSMLDDFRAKAFHAFAEAEKSINAIKANAAKVADMIAAAAVNVSGN